LAWVMSWVAHLERVVGSRLVERERGQRSVRLTAVGAVLAGRADEVLAELRAARIDLSVSAGCVDRAVRLAFVGDLAPLVGRLLAAVGERADGVAVEASEVADERELVRCLERGRADLAVGVSVAGSGVGCVALGADAFVVLARAGSRVAGLGCVSSPAELSGERLLVAASVLAHARQLHAPGLGLDRAVRVPLGAAVAGLVARGHGIGLLPASLLAASPGLVEVPTAGLIAPRRLMLAWHAARRPSPAIQAICDITTRAYHQQHHQPRAA
jgi:DNA-binding transcriptional LysR family regulator